MTLLARRIKLKIKMTKKQLKAYKEHNKQMRNAFRQIDKICKKFNINRVELLRAIL